MTRILTGDDAAEYERIVKELHIARMAADQVSNKYGIDSEEFKKADAYVSVLTSKKRALDGESGYG